MRYLLTKLGEESGEVVQQVCKSLLTRKVSKELIREAADLQVMLEIFYRQLSEEEKNLSDLQFSQRMTKEKRKGKAWTKGF